MNPAGRSVLTINAGSSSIRFAIYEVGGSMVRRLGGKIERADSGDSITIITDTPARSQIVVDVTNTGHRAVADALLDWLAAQPLFATVHAIGHRVVYGMAYSEPQRVTPALLAELGRFTQYDPDHLPREIEIIEECVRRHPDLPQLACFDTTFHRTMPRVAKMLPIPRRYLANGIERYGFHGLSYSFLMEELGRLDPDAARGRVILAHLGSGASLAAVQGGLSIDTSMGFTPASGLVMGTRTGDLDPGLFYYLSQNKKMDASRFHQMVNQESGLLGISETSSDVRDLIAAESSDVRAAEAVALFCYQAKKWIGSFAAALGGVSTLVFAGGIGENSSLIRARICDGLSFLGIELDDSLNAENAAVISANDSPATVRVIRTNEELVIARSVQHSFAAILAE